MAYAGDIKAMLYQNLIDAGYNESEANQCLILAQNREWIKLSNMLAQQRTVLLNKLHKSEEQIDCLDFLVYEIKKTHINGGKENV